MIRGLEKGVTEVCADSSFRFCFLPTSFVWDREHPMVMGVGLGGQNGAMSHVSRQESKQCEFL